jgi:hypothetical protein
LVGCTVLSTVTGVPFFSLFWPLLTTTWPASRPLTMAIWSPRVGPVSTKICWATSCGLPCASVAGGAGAPGVAGAPGLGASACFTTYTVEPYGL